MPEHVDRYPAARIPVAADPEPTRGEQRDEILADAYRAVLVKRSMISEGSEVKL